MAVDKLGSEGDCSDTQQKAVSVVIPLYNKKSTVARAINSILAQDSVNAEIIVVDDGSTDNPEEVIRAFGRLVRYVRQENSGPSAARNRGAHLSTHPVLLFLDADDELVPGCLAKHLQMREIVPGLQLTVASFRVVAGDRVIREENILLRLPAVNRVSGGILVDRFYSDLITNIASGSICVDKRLFDEVGGFDEMLWCWEITDLMYRLVLKADQIGIPASVQLVVHENAANSQFEKTRSDLRYRVRFAHRLLDKMDLVPRTQRYALLCSVKNTLRSAMYGGGVANLRALSERAKCYAEDIPEIRKFCRIGLLPPFLLRSWLALRKIYRR